MEPKISLCMIVKNEEQNIRRCLKSVAGAVDEIIVVDTGSTDATAEIAREYRARVHFFPWNDNFSDARNASLDLASGDWILFLDADEELAAGSGEALRRLAGGDAVDGYFVQIINYLGSEGYLEPCADLVFRLFRNHKDYRFRGSIHEQIVDVILEKNNRARYRAAEEIVILHYGYLDRQIAEKGKIDRNLTLLKRELAATPGNRLLRYHYGVELYRAKKYKEAAEQLLQAAQGIDPQTIYLPKLLRHIVLSCYAACEYAPALDIIRQGLELFPHYADLYYYGGMICFDRGEYGRAVEFFQQALATPGQPVYFASFYGVRGFRACYQLGRLAEMFLNEDEAMRYYVLSLRDNPSFLPALESIIRLLRPREEPAYAKKCLEQLCDFCSPGAALLLGRMFFQQQAYVPALEYLERGATEGNPDGEISLYRAVCLAQQRRFLEALRILDSFHPAQPLYPLARMNQLLCFWWQGKQRKAKDLAKELFALGLSPDTETVVTLLIGTPGKGKPEAAPGEGGMALLLDILARTLDLGENELASRLLEGLTTDCRRQNAVAVGRIYHRYGYLDAAEHYLEIDRHEHPDCAETLSLLAEIKEKRQEYLAAVELYQRALAVDPGKPQHYMRLIRLYEKMRQSIIQKAEQIFPGPDDAHKILQEAAEK
ncbi:tetratricopeptide repeat-containing glycosyltransferase family 2 protein [Desulfotomaculum copahuensis]|uniref:Glycosyl transferase family 2 n=1 Tax=Desulfotomaculum copahuensis TaxID=1838280 RepID=A0A1B7LD66_9FIRM|nr:TPR domain-containing glycosyltransferase [Desulfotomaculum copahuensis]OAT80876.1 glycosyl transferase family 2 [Desulfotomaculum copahuensis]